MWEKPLGAQDIRSYYVGALKTRMLSSREKLESPSKTLLGPFVQLFLLIKNLGVKPMLY